MNSTFEDIAALLADLVVNARPSITLANGVVTVQQGDRTYTIPVTRTIVTSQNNHRTR